MIHVVANIALARRVVRLQAPREVAVRARVELDAVLSHQASVATRNDVWEPLQRTFSLLMSRQALLVSKRSRRNVCERGRRRALLQPRQCLAEIEGEGCYVLARRILCWLGVKLSPQTAVVLGVQLVWNSLR